MDEFEKENGNGSSGGADDGKTGDPNRLSQSDPDGFYGYGFTFDSRKPEKIFDHDATEEEKKPLNPPQQPEEKENEDKEEYTRAMNTTVKTKGDNDVDATTEKRDSWREDNGNNNDKIIKTTLFLDNEKDNDKDIFEKNKGKQGGRKICEDFEQILELVGGDGKYQKILLYAVLCPIVTISPFLVLNTIFMWDTPDHWCHVPGFDATTMSLEEWKNITLPWEMGPDGQMRHSQCNMFDTNSTEERIVKCQSGWEYDTTDYSSTVPSEFDWVCDRDYYATDCFTWGSIGSAIGTVIFGIMADKYGRKPVFFSACFTNMLFKTASLFLAQHYVLYKFAQLFGGLAFPALFSMPALISAEVSGTDYRSWIYAVTWMIWVVGNSIIPFVAMLCRGWFLFGCVAATPGLLLFLYYPMVDDSPRWLITQGKTKEALKIILKIAKTNERHVDEDVLEEMVNELAKKQKKERSGKSIGAWTLFSRLRLAKNTVMLTIAWTMNSLLYYGVTLNTTHMAGNQFINYFVLSLIELPGGWVAGKLVEVTGRRWTQVALFLLCTVSCLVCSIAVAYPNSAVVVIIGALGIKFGVAITSLVAYLQGTEIFPTQLRSTGSGLASTVASTVGIFGPYIVYSGTVHVSFPYILLCISSFLGLLSAACLPETLEQNLPETIEDANDFGKGHKFWSYLPQAQEKRKRNSVVEGGH